MNKAVNHMIKSATLDFVFNGKTDGFSFQQEIKEWFEELMQKLDQELDELSVNEKVIFIDQLQLEIQLSASDWKQQAANKVMEQLKDKFSLISTGAMSSQGFAEKTTAVHFKDSFLYFLKKGYLPWQVSSLEKTEWNKLLEQLIMQADHRFVQELKQLLQSSAASKQRFASIIPFQSALQLFRYDQSTGASAHRQMIHDLQLLMKISVVNHLNETKQLLHQLFLDDVTGTINEKQIKKELIAVLRKKISRDALLFSTLTELPFQTKLFLELQQELKVETKQRRETKEKSGALKNKSQQQEASLLLLQLQSTENSGEEIYISNAGLVVLAAFIPALFEKTKLMKEQKIKDADKAVCLLQFLVTGTEKNDEFEMVLPKILCAVPIDQAVDTDRFHLNKLYKKEADDVLTSVIEYWNILQNTSVNGLRESFLKRNGKLTYDGNDWLLQVEQQPYDMLLQHLPWNISMIKLPWMDQFLKTEWIY